jgi:hypothetical protein
MTDTEQEAKRHQEADDRVRMGYRKVWRQDGMPEEWQTAAMLELNAELLDAWTDPQPGGR